METTNARQILREQNCHKVATSNSIEVQYPDSIVHKERVPECEIGDTSIVKSDLDSNNSRNLQLLNEEKVWESEVGSALEVTDEMLKSCRRRSVLKRRKPGACDLVLGNKDPDTTEFTECNKQDKSQRERRVTFNEELEFKLPDGRQEFVELVIDDSDGQLVIEDDQNKNTLPVFNDILSHEVSGEERNTECNATEGKSASGEDHKELDGEITDERNGHARSDTESCEIRGDEKAKTNNDEKDKSSSRHVKKDAVQELKPDENLRFLVEADILLSADRQAQSAQMNSGNDAIKHNTKTPKTEDEVPVSSLETDCGETGYVQLRETGERAKGHAPRRGMRHEASTNNNAKPSKRLVDVFGSEIKARVAEIKEPLKNEGKVEQNKKGKITPSKNESQSRKLTRKRASGKASHPRENDEGFRKNCHRKKELEKTTEEAKESLVIENEIDDRKRESFGDWKREKAGVEDKDDVKEKQDIVDQNCGKDVNDSVRHVQNMIDKEKGKTKRGRKINQPRKKNQGIARNSRRKKELEKTAQVAKESLVFENKIDICENGRADIEGHNKKGEPVGVKVKDSAEEIHDVDAQFCQEHKENGVRQDKNMVDEVKAKNKRSSKKANKPRNEEEDFVRSYREKNELEKIAEEDKESLVIENVGDPDENKNTKIERHHKVDPNESKNTETEEKHKTGESVGGWKAKESLVIENEVDPGENKNTKIEEHDEVDPDESKNTETEEKDRKAESVGGWKAKESLVIENEVDPGENKNTKIEEHHEVDPDESKNTGTGGKDRKAESVGGWKAKESFVIENEVDPGESTSTETEEQDIKDESFGDSKREEIAVELKNNTKEKQDTFNQSCAEDVKDGFSQGQNEVDSTNISDEVKERKSNLRSKKKKPVPKLEIMEENIDDATEHLSKNMDNVKSEENEQHVNESDKKQTKVKDITENKGIKINLRSRKRKSQELDNEGTNKQNSNDVMFDVNEDEKAELENRSKKGKVSISNMGKGRKATLKSKRRKSSKPEVDDGKIVDLNKSKETTKVDFEAGIPNESLRENIKPKIKNKKQTERNANKTKTKSHTFAVCSKRKSVSRKVRKKESLLDVDQKIKGEALNTENADQEINSGWIDMEGIEDDGEKQAEVEAGETVFPAANAIVSRIMQSGDRSGRKTEEKGRKRDLLESEEINMKEKEKSEVKYKK